MLTGAFLKAAKQVVLRAWLCISRAVNNISTSKHFTSLTIPKEQNPLIFNGWVPPPQADSCWRNPWCKVYLVVLEDVWVWKAHQSKVCRVRPRRKKMNHVVLEKSGLKHPAKSKPVTHFDMQVYKKERFQYEHFQRFGIFTFLGKQNIEACDTKPRKKVDEQLLKYWFRIFCLFWKREKLGKVFSKIFWERTNSLKWIENVEFRLFEKSYSLRRQTNRQKNWILPRKLNFRFSWIEWEYKTQNFETKVFRCT